jgi:hypothetical protein
MWSSLNALTSQLFEGALEKRSPVNFFERTYFHDQILFCLNYFTYGFSFRSGCEPGWFAEQFHDIMERLLTGMLRHESRLMIKHYVQVVARVISQVTSSLTMLAPVLTSRLLLMKWPESPVIPNHF